MRTSDADFDYLLDEWQEQQYELAVEAEDRSYESARRPNAERVETTFGDLRVGDFMTAEGSGGRWVEVVEINEITGLNGKLAITFRTTEYLGVGMHNRWVIDRDPTEVVVVDGTTRPEPPSS